MTPAAHLLITSFFKNNYYLYCALSKGSEKCFKKSLFPYTLCLPSISLNGNFVDIEKADGICSPTFAIDKLSRLFLYFFIISSVFSIKN